MKRVLTCLASGLLLAACSGQDQAPAPQAADTVKDSGVMLDNFDKSVKPQSDFYHYVDGKWLAKTQIPADRSNYGSFSILADEAEQHLHEILEKSSSATNATAGSETQQIGDMYASFMDVEHANELGIKPLADEFQRIDAVASKDDLVKLFAHYQRIGVQSPMGMYVNTDAKQSDRYIVYFYQSGLGLPDRDYYLSDEKKFQDIRAQYLAHIGNMLQLAGMDDSEAAATKILALESRLAKNQWSRVESRDDTKTYNKYAVGDLNQVMPDFDWTAYMHTAGADAAKDVVVSQPSFFTALDKAFDDVPLATWKAYARWSLINSFAPYLSKPVVDADFAFYGKTLRGVEENRPRWKRGVNLVEGSLGMALGKIYVAKYFKPQAKAQMEHLVQNLLAAYRESIKHLDWMTDATKEKALDKLAKFTPKIGYPDKWRDYAGLEVKRDDLVGNVMRSNAFDTDYQLGKLGQPVDRSEWHMTPQTVNAYYNPGMNEIVFPAAILQPPFFDPNADMAVNYGGIGAVIGHEIGHGFDDQGSKYDGNGNMENWWTDADRSEFEKRTKALIDQYSGYCPLKDGCVNGELTIGENIGDLGGLSIAYKAYHMALGDQKAPELDGFTGDQRFFIGWAQVWARKYREQELVNRLKTDPHSPSQYRCNGVLRNMPAFYQAFDVKPDDGMYLPQDKRVRIW